MKRQYTRTNTARSARLPGAFVYPDSLDLLRSLAEKFGLNQSLILEMGLLALQDAELDRTECPNCGAWVVNDPNEWGHLKSALTQAHGDGDTCICPRCKAGLYPE